MDLTFMSQSHLSSWSKARLGWLDYETVDWVGDGWTYWENWVDALPTFGYGDKVYNHLVHETWRFTYGEYIFSSHPIEYIIEVRTENESYSSWDTRVPGTGLAMYKAESWSVMYRDTERLYAFGEEVNEVDGSPFTTGSSPISTEGDMSFTVLSDDNTPNTYKMRISAQTTTENQLWFIMRQVPIRLSDNGQLTGASSIWPDLDLHAYTHDGRHVGMNYETGEYEIGIEGALASGDYFNGSEWIRLPAGVKAYFTTSSRDVGEFLTANPEAQLEFDNSIYAVGSRYHDEQGEQYKSTPMGQGIQPGAEIFSQLEVVQNPDGTYSVVVEEAKDLFDLAMWHTAIDNLADNIFTKNPTQRKSALKEKFDEVFEELEGAEEGIQENEADEAKEHYQEAAEKLANDILKKLDADGKADWLRQPALVDKLMAFIGILSYKAGGGE